MKARYLIRFDDICPTSNWSIWGQVEKTLHRYDIKPILAVVPDNKDSKLQVEPSRPDFWEWLREKQLQGWTITMHGYQHVYETHDAGLLGINRRSEFAGLPAETQRKKIEKGLEIFHQHEVYPQAFVAPAHSFDRNTLEALRNTGIHVISDGFFLGPKRWMDMIWIPQQMWQFRRMPMGIWTVCYHHNRFNQQEMEQFTRDVARFAPHIISLDEAVAQCDGQAGVRDHIFSRIWLSMLRIKLGIRSILGVHNENLSDPR